MGIANDKHNRKKKIAGKNASKECRIDSSPAGRSAIILSEKNAWNILMEIMRENPDHPGHRKKKGGSRFLPSRLRSDCAQFEWGAFAPLLQGKKF